MPERAIDPYNLTFTKGGGRGSPHSELHKRAVGEEMSSRPPTAVRQAVAPARAEARGIEATATQQRGVDANGVPDSSEAVTRGRLGDAPGAPDPVVSGSGRIVPKVPSPAVPGEIGQAPRADQPKIVESGPPVAARAAEPVLPATGTLPAKPVMAEAPVVLRGAGLSRGAMLEAFGVEFAVQFAAAWALQKILEAAWPGFFGEEMLVRDVQARMLEYRFSDRLRRRMQLLHNVPEVRARFARARCRTHARSAKNCGEQVLTDLPGRSIQTVRMLSASVVVRMTESILLISVRAALPPPARRRRTAQRCPDRRFGGASRAVMSGRCAFQSRRPDARARSPRR